jgi:hypothetical protein
MNTLKIERYLEFTYEYPPPPQKWMRLWIDGKLYAERAEDFDASTHEFESYHEAPPVMYVSHIRVYRLQNLILWIDNYYDFFLFASAIYQEAFMSGSIKDLPEIDLPTLSYMLLQHLPDAATVIYTDPPIENDVMGMKLVRYVQEALKTETIELVDEPPIWMEYTIGVDDEEKGFSEATWRVGESAKPHAPPVDNQPTHSGVPGSIYWDSSISLDCTAT